MRQLFTQSHSLRLWHLTVLFLEQAAWSILLGWISWMCYTHGLLCTSNSASVSLCQCVYTVFQEASRSVRRVADPINSWIAGSGAGYILTASQRTLNWNHVWDLICCIVDGHRAGIRTGLYGGLAVGGLHYLKDCIPVGIFRQILISWDLLDPPEEDIPLETRATTQI